MKFVFAVVMLALAAGVQSSLLAAQVAPGVSYVTSALHPGGAWGGPWAGAWGGHDGAWGGHGGAWAGHGGAWAGHGGAWGGHAGAWGGPAAVDIGAHGPWGLGGGHGGWGGYPGISLSQGPGHAAAAHGHGVYVAKTRGAIHTAPLAGHINSATSVNVAPAPGTH